MIKNLTLTSFLWLLAGLAGSAIFIWIAPQSPSANLPVHYTKDNAEEIASSLITDLGYDIDTYRRAFDYSTHRDESGYIQQSLEWSEAKNAIEEYGVQHWHVRFLQPPAPEEFIVAIHPITGNVINFIATLPDDAKGASLESEEALAIAQTFAEEQGYAIEKNFEIIQNSPRDQVNRRDYTFVWRHKNRAVADAPFEISVDIAGDKISKYSAILNIPDSYSQQYNTQETYGYILATISLVFVAILFIFALKFTLQYYKKDIFHSRLAWIAGGLVTGMLILSDFNTLTTMWFNFPSFAPPQYAFVVIAITLGMAIIVGAITAVFMGTGLELARSQGLPQSFKKSQHILVSAIRGTSLAGISLGFISVFMWIGYKYFGIWSPGMEMPLVAFVPSLIALTMGLLPAISEETAFRLFGIPFLKKYVKYSFLAVIIMGVIFGLAHSTYPIFPIYTRAIEASIIGIAIGFFFLRYGILTTMVWHYSYNALLVASGLFLAGLSGYVLHGVIAVVIALLPLIGAIGWSLYNKQSKK